MQMLSKASTASCLNMATRADQKTGSTLLEFSGRTAMHGKSRVSSAIKYDCFKFDDSGNCIIIPKEIKLYQKNDTQKST